MDKNVQAIVGIIIFAVFLAIARAVNKRLQRRAAVASAEPRTPRPNRPRPYAEPQVASVATPTVVAATPAPTLTEAIFISYRRADDPHAAHRLYDYLADRFGQRSVFIDLDTIEPGADFVQVIDEAIGRCRVLLAMIGPKWLAASDQGGTLRINDPGDYVRVEIESALRRRILVIPVLVDAQMPAASELPGTLRDLSRRNAFSLRVNSFRADCQRLADQIDRFLSPSSIRD
jgi:TIR domain